MPKIEEIKEKYFKDSEETGHKSKFGFFSMPPTASAGHNAFQQKTVVKDQNGRVKTENRNIYSGLTSSGTTKKNYFHYETSIFSGQPFLDPGKLQQKQKYQETKKMQGKDKYKPSSLCKSPDAKAAYEYIPEKYNSKQVKDFVDQNGRVKTKERNICSSPQSKVEKQKLKQIKYVPDPYQHYKKVEAQYHKKSIQLRGEAPFKLSSNKKEYFSNVKQIFGNQGVTSERKERKIFNASAQHDGNFRPSCHKKIDVFSFPEYIPSGQKEGLPKIQRNSSSGNVEAFKPVKQPNKFKPSPSVSCMKANVLRSIR